MKWLGKKEKIELAPLFDEQRANLLPSIGEKLRVTRQGYAFELDEVVAYTKIARKLLQAIEEADFSNLPEPIYIRGLIKRYADALGLDGTELANSFPIEVNRVVPKPSWRINSSGQLRPVHLYLLYIGTIACSVTGLSHVLNGGTFQANNAGSSPQPQSATSVSASAQQNQQFDLQSVANPSNNPKQPVQVGLTLKESSWVRVEVDGKTEFEGVLPQGSQRSWKGQAQLVVRTRNAGAVLVSVNEQQAKPMGELGKAEQFIVAANTRS
jgi:cytoskeletal protein RodZ